VPAVSVPSPYSRSNGRLGPYLACAAAVHAAIFAISSLRSVRGAAVAQAAAVVRAVRVEVEPGVIDLPAPPRGEASAIAGDSMGASARPAIPAPRRARADENVAAIRSALQESEDRRQRDMGRAAAVAVAAGRPPGGGPPGSFGAWGGATPIRGNIAFGNGSHGALTGRVCFLPVGTLRIADAGECQYVATVYTDTLNIPERHFSDGFPGVSDRSEWFLIDYAGTFSVTAYGTYVFRLHSDDGSYLYIDDSLVIDNDGKHAPESRSGTVQLSVGDHRIKVRYAQTDDRMALQLFVRPPGGAEILFTPRL